jgi:hypothetical protein
VQSGSLGGYDAGPIRSLTQEDPIGLAGGLNLYGFAAGDPVNLADPFGLSALECPPCTPEPEGGPPVGLPPGASGRPNSWKKIPGTGERPTKWVPREPIPSPKGGQPGGSWDPEGSGHWDVDDGQGNHRRFRPDGTEVDHDGKPVDHPGPNVVPAPDATQMRQMAAGAALGGVLYWIISEGSRILFPPRNLVPVP